jgi:hypothetical protein
MAEPTDDFLAHYGVLGMHWGKRNAESQVRLTTKEKTKVGPSHDAVQAKVAKSTAKSSGVAALNNNELQAYIRRANLEQQYSKLNPSTVKKGDTYVKEGLAVAGTATALYALYKSPLGQIVTNKVKDSLNTPGDGKHVQLPAKAKHL